MNELEAYKKITLDLYKSYLNLLDKNLQLQGMEATAICLDDFELEKIIQGKIKLLMEGDIKGYMCESDLEEEE